MNRPAGATKVSGTLCDDATGGGVTGVIEGSIFGSSSYAEQLGGLNAAYGSATVELPAAQRAYRAFLRAGFPSSSVVVKDLTAQIAALRSLIRARQRRDLAAVPAIYVLLKQADFQFIYDAQDSVCTS